MPRSRVCGQSETVREGYRGTFNAFESLSAWRQPCFAGFVSRSAASLRFCPYLPEQRSSQRSSIPVRAARGSARRCSPGPIPQHLVSLATQAEPSRSRTPPHSRRPSRSTRADLATESSFCPEGTAVHTDWYRWPPLTLWRTAHWLPRCETSTGRACRASRPMPHLRIAREVLPALHRVLPPADSRLARSAPPGYRWG